MKRLAGLAALLALSIAAACSTGQSNTTPLVNAAASNAPTLGSTYQTNAVNGMTSYVNTAGTGSVSVTASASAPSGVTAFARTVAEAKAMSANGTPILFYTITANTATTITNVGFVTITMPNAPSGNTYMATLRGSQWLTVGGQSAKAGTYANGSLSVPGGALNGKTGIALNAGQSLYAVVYVGNIVATPSPTPTPVATPSLTSAVLSLGSTIPLGVAASGSVTATSSDTTVVTVSPASPAAATPDPTGQAQFKVTAVGPGSAKITFADTNGHTSTFTATVSNIQNGAFTQGLTGWYTCSFTHTPYTKPVNEATPIPVANPNAQTTTSPALGTVANSLATAAPVPPNDNPQLPSGVGPSAPPALGSTAALIGTLDASTNAQPSGAFGLCQDVTVSANTPYLTFWVWDGGSNYNFKTADTEADVLNQNKSPLQAPLFAEDHCYVDPTNQLGSPGAASTSGCWPPPKGDSNHYNDWIGGGFWTQRGPFDLSAYKGQKVTLYFGDWVSSGSSTNNAYSQFMFLGSVQMLPTSAFPTMAPFDARHPLTIRLSR